MSSLTTAATLSDTVGRGASGTTGAVGVAMLASPASCADAMGARPRLRADTAAIAKPVMLRADFINLVVPLSVWSGGDAAIRPNFIACSLYRPMWRGLGAGSPSPTGPASGCRSPRAPRRPPDRGSRRDRSEEHTSELQSQSNLVC